MNTNTSGVAGPSAGRRILARAAAVSWALQHHPPRRRMGVAIGLPIVTGAVLMSVSPLVWPHHERLELWVGLVVTATVALLLAQRRLRPMIATATLLRTGLHELVQDGSDPTGDESDDIAPEPRSNELTPLVVQLRATRRVLLEQRAAELAGEQSRRELLSFLCHDLRTPLSGLRALSEALEDGVMADDDATWAHVRRTVDRMADLVEDLSAVSVVGGAGPDATRSSLVSLSEVIHRVAAEASAAAAVRQVTLRVDVPDGDQLAVHGVAADLIRAFGNLAANAVRHTGPQLSVCFLGRRAEDGRVQITVLDGCGGIPEEALPTLFDTGWRGAATSHSPVGLAGLGLAIARGVVQRHRGTIAVRNVGPGCCFDVDLPASDPPDPLETSVGEQR